MLEKGKIMFALLMVVFGSIGITACGLGMAIDLLGAEITSDLLWQIFAWAVIGVIGSLCLLILHETIEISVVIKRKEGA